MTKLQKLPFFHIIWFRIEKKIKKKIKFEIMRFEKFSDNMRQKHIRFDRYSN